VLSQHVKPHGEEGRTSSYNVKSTTMRAPHQQKTTTTTLTSTSMTFLYSRGELRTHSPSPQYGLTPYRVPVSSCMSIARSDIIDVLHEKLPPKSGTYHQELLARFLTMRENRPDLSRRRVLLLRSLTIRLKALNAQADVQRCMLFSKYGSEILLLLHARIKESQKKTKLRARKPPVCRP
jgi:hypothetical protein